PEGGRRPRSYPPGERWLGGVGTMTTWPFKNHRRVLLLRLQAALEIHRNCDANPDGFGSETHRLKLGTAHPLYRCTREFGIRRTNRLDGLSIGTSIRIDRDRKQDATIYTASARARRIVEGLRIVEYWPLGHLHRVIHGGIRQRHAAAERRMAGCSRCAKGGDRHYHPAS